MAVLFASGGRAALRRFSQPCRKPCRPLLGAEPAFYLYELVALSRRGLFTLCWVVFRGNPYAQGVSLLAELLMAVSFVLRGGAIVPGRCLETASGVTSRGADFQLADFCRESQFLEGSWR